MTQDDPLSEVVDLPELRRAASSLRHPLARALLVLTFVSGLIDATTYLGLGHVFVANMTGNVLLLGFGIAGTGNLPVLAPLVSLACFLAGGVATGRICGGVGGRYHQLLLIGIAIEVAALLVATVLTAAVAVRTGHVSADLVIAVLALGMGVRNVTVRTLAVPDLTTTVVTSTLAALASRSRLAGADGAGTARRVAGAVALICGAVAGGLLIRTSLTLALATATAFSAATLVAYRMLIPAWLQAPRAADAGGPRG